MSDRRLPSAKESSDEVQLDGDPRPMPKVEVFDPPMCCNSGVCGPEPDERLAQFSANLDWLKRHGIEVRRYNLAQEPTAFTARLEVAKILRETDGNGLPIILVDGNVASHGDYPSQQKLAELTGLPSQPERGILSRSPRRA